MTFIVHSCLARFADKSHRTLIRREAKAECIYSFLGIAYLNLGRLNEAMEMHEQQLAISKKFGHKVAEGLAYGNLGSVYTAKQNFTHAIKAFHSSLAIAKSTNDKIAEATTSGNIGNILFKLGLRSEAEKYWLMHRSMSREIGDVDGEQRAALNLAQLGKKRKSIG